MLQTGTHRQWLAVRNLWDGQAERLADEVVVYCLTLLALRPHEVPEEVVIYLAEHHPFLKGVADFEV